MSVGLSVTDQRRARGQRTRALILARAVDVASAQGLDGLSLGALASDLGLSKSGVSGHFASRTRLQLGVISVAAHLYAERVVIPTRAQDEGVGRVWTFCDRWIAFMQSGELLGRSFFLTALVEYDARPGPVRDALIRYRGLWERIFIDEWHGAERQGDVVSGINAPQLFFEIAGLVAAATLESQLRDDVVPFVWARDGALLRLRPLLTERGADALSGAGLVPVSSSGIG